MTAPDPADTVIEQGDLKPSLADALRAAISSVETGPRTAQIIEALIPVVQARIDALADPADRDELEAWRSGRRRKSWPSIKSVPDGLHYAAELVRAQGTEGGDTHDALLRGAAARLKALNDIAPVLLAEKERAEAERDVEYRKYAQEADRAEALEAEVARLKQQLAETRAEVDAYSVAQVAELRATVARVATLRDRWAILAGQAMNADTREWLDAASKSLRAALGGAGEQ